MNLNPMAITGPTPAANYVQPDTIAHPVSAAVAVYPTGTDVLQLHYTAPPVKYSQPLSAADNPHSTIPF
jgi:hypothetical protein